jgi:hypothetical protein
LKEHSTTLPSNPPKVTDNLFSAEIKSEKASSMESGKFSPVKVMRILPLTPVWLISIEFN